MPNWIELKRNLGNNAGNILLAISVISGLGAGAAGYGIGVKDGYNHALKDILGTPIPRPLESPPEEVRGTNPKFQEFFQQIKEISDKDPFGASEIRRSIDLAEKLLNSSGAYQWSNKSLLRSDLEDSRATIRDDDEGKKRLVVVATLSGKSKDLDLVYLDRTTGSALALRCNVDEATKRCFISISPMEEQYMDDFFTKSALLGRALATSPYPLPGEIQGMQQFALTQGHADRATILAAIQNYRDTFDPPPPPPGTPDGSNKKRASVTILEIFGSSF